MEKITLSAQSRKALGKLNNNLRKTGKMPAVLYGHNVTTQNLEVNERDFQKVFKQAGESTIVSLDIDGKAVPVIIQDVQLHFLRDNPIHVDFYAVNMTEELKANIPLHIIGEAPAVKALGGVLVKNLNEIEVECLPADLPHAVEIDISKLNTFEDVIRVSDIKLSDKVKVLTAPDEMIVTVAPPRSEEEMKALEEKPVEADVSKVEGVVKPADSAEATGPDAELAAKKDAPENENKTRMPFISTPI